ncbi:hypothetical protein UlMin_003750 [Ulmus minor]
MDLVGAKVVLVKWALAICFMMLVSTKTSAVVLCDVDSNNLPECRPAVSGNSPSPPSEKCCAIVHQANLPCLCNYKSVLPAFGIDPVQAMELPKKCGLKTPRECHGKNI